MNTIRIAKHESKIEPAVKTNVSADLDQPVVEKVASVSTKEPQILNTTQATTPSPSPTTVSNYIVKNFPYIMFLSNRLRN